MSPQISIIVPVYKAEKYLYRCIDSILVQTFKDFELLLVDDGSPDNSGAICDEYAVKDKRIKVVHKNNGGVSSARQCGIDNACGEYTIHVDPDDWIEPIMLEELYDKAIKEKADIVICDFFIDESINKSIYCTQKPQKLEQDAILRELLMQKLHGSCCNKMIKRILYENNSITFPIEIIRWEDLYVITQILAKVPVKVTYLEKAFYHYIQYLNVNSIVRNTTIEGLTSQILFINSISKILDKEKYAECFYKLKSATKELAFTSGLYSNRQVHKLYSEINEDYICDKHIYYNAICLTKLLKGHFLLSRILLCYYRYKELLISCIKRSLIK